jgi:SPP1 family predicted phage head-tail adaptor
MIGQGRHRQSAPAVAGSLRHRLIIERPAYPPDGAGGGGRVWTRLAEVWASLDVAGGDRIVLDDRAVQHITYRMRLRWRGDLTAEMRFRLDDRIFRILTLIDSDGRRRWLDCLTTEDSP